MAYVYEKSLTSRAEVIYAIHDTGLKKLSTSSSSSFFSTSSSSSTITIGPILSSIAPQRKILSYILYPFTYIFPFFSRLFLPRGKVAKEYTLFQLCDSIQATCSYLRGVLTIHSILVGVGVGSENASALAATLSFLLRDGASRIGSLLFSYLFSLTLDAEIKFWRIFADIINDIGLTLELFAPLAGTDYFVIVLCIANICKALCGVAAEATRVAISAHFALENNMAEVQAKEGSQENAITLLGMGLGYLLAPYLNASPYHQYLTFGILTIIHILANWYGVRILALRTLNRGRLHIQTLHWLPTMLNNISSLSTSSFFPSRNKHISNTTITTPWLQTLPTPFTPEEIATIEPIFPVHYSSILHSYLYKLFPTSCLSYGRKLKSLFTNTTKNMDESVGIMFRTSRTPINYGNLTSKQQQDYLHHYVVYDEGMQLSLGTSLVTLQSIANIAATENDITRIMNQNNFIYNHSSSSSMLWTKYVYIVLCNNHDLTPEISTSFIWANLYEVLMILYSNNPLPLDIIDNNNTYNTNTPNKGSTPNTIRQRRISISSPSSTKVSTPMNNQTQHSTPTKKSSTTVLSSEAEVIATLFIQSRITGIPINGFCISAHSLSAYNNASTISPSITKHKHMNEPTIGIGYFHGITAKMKLAAYLTAHIASQIGGLTASLITDKDASLLCAALRICSFNYTTSPPIPNHQNNNEILLYQPLLEQYIQQLNNSGWDTIGLQLAEDGYRISL